MLLSRPLALLPIAEGDTSKGQRRCVTGDSFFWSLSARDRKLVCVTSGNSYFGAHLIKELLSHGYLIRATIQDEGNLEDMKRLLSDEEMNMLESVVAAKMGDLDNLCDAFRGCHIIFHTSAFIDPHGVSGYTERTAFLEAEGAKNVIEACGRAAYIKRCILTSSLLASIWRHETTYDGSSSTSIVDETCWSDEEICRQNKLWLALGKTKAEKAAWSAAKEMKVRLVTICPGFITAPSSPNAGYECSLPYMKGGRVMFQRGFLASTDVDKLAKVHVQVYEAMEYGASGRYICFQRVVTRLDEAIQLENVLKLHGILSGGRNVASSGSSSSSSSRTEEEDGGQVQGRISSSKLERLLYQASRRFSCRNEDCIGSV